MPESQEVVLITIVVASVFVVLIGSFLLMLVFVFQRRQRKNKQEKEELKNRYERTLLKTQLEILEQTFSYISQEIHDNIGQVLSLVRLNLNTLGISPADEKFIQTDDLLGKAIKDLRDLSHNLQNNQIHHIGSIEAIRQLLFSLQKTGHYKTSFTASDHFHILDVNTDIILYRMIQEIINNIIKHAAASEIDIAVIYETNITLVRISDNGVGFDTIAWKEQNAGTGIGLKNIAKRAKIINAAVDIKSAPGNGTVITLSIKPKLITT